VLKASTQLSLFGELRLAEKKSHRKYCFQFSQYSLSYRSSPKVVSALHSYVYMCVYVCMAALTETGNV